jgi:hypothetical protein
MWMSWQDVTLAVVRQNVGAVSGKGNSLQMDMSEL